MIWCVATLFTAPSRVCLLQLFSRTCLWQWLTLLWGRFVLEGKNSVRRQFEQRFILANLSQAKYSKERSGLTQAGGTQWAIHCGLWISFKSICGLIDTYRIRSPFPLPNNVRQDFPFKEFLLKSSRKAHKAGDRWLKSQYRSHCMVVIARPLEGASYRTCVGGCPGELVSDLVGAALLQLQDVQPQRSHWTNSRYCWYQDVAMVSSVTLYLILCLRGTRSSSLPIPGSGKLRLAVVQLPLWVWLLVTLYPF